jgi:hypothetical protein
MPPPASICTTRATTGNSRPYVVAPGADPSRIQTEVLSSTLVERAPIAWQTIDERDVAIPVRYLVAADGTVSFALGAYDRSQRLVIDPTLVRRRCAG